MIVNRVKLADICGVSKTTVDAWVGLGCPVIEKSGKSRPSKYDTVDVFRWLTDAGDDLNLDRERTLLTIEQRKKLALQNARSEKKGWCRWRLWRKFGYGSSARRRADSCRCLPRPLPWPMLPRALPRYRRLFEGRFMSPWMVAITILWEISQPRRETAFSCRNSDSN